MSGIEIRRERVKRPKADIGTEGSARLLSYRYIYNGFVGIKKAPFFSQTFSYDQLFYLIAPMSIQENQEKPCFFRMGKSG